MLDLHTTQDILRRVQNRQPQLPIFRTDTQRKLLVELLFDADDQPQTLTDLATVIGVEQTTVMREVNRLLESGLIIETRVGRARTVQIDETSPYAAPLRQLIRAASLPTTERGVRRHAPREERHRHERSPLPSAQTRP